MASFKTRKFSDINQLDHHLNGGVIGGSSKKQFYDLVDKTLVFTQPAGFTVTFTSGSQPGGLLTFAEATGQIVAQSTGDSVRAWAIGDQLALRQKVPAVGGGITIGSASTALAELGFAAGKAVVGRVYAYPDGVLTPTAPFFVSVTGLGTHLVLVTQE